MKGIIFIISLLLITLVILYGGDALIYIGKFLIKAGKILRLIGIRG